MVLSLQGCMAVGKTSATRWLEAHDPTLQISYEDNAAVLAEVRRRGLDKTRCSDYIEIQPGRLKEDLVLPGHGDHRIIMAEAILSLVCPLTIDDERAAGVTFPTFFNLLESIKKEA